MSVAERYQQIVQRVEAARNSCGAAAVRLIAVSKRQPLEKLRAAYAAGCRDFGENYVQELKQKAAAAPPDCRWHFIGHLQRNKVKQLPSATSLVHGVDRLRLAQSLARHEQESTEVLLQVNLSNEDTKSGCREADVPQLLEELQALEGLRVVGFMTLPPPVAEPEDARRFFARLFELRERFGGAAVLPELSMGMSHDFEVAISEGATMVRVGTAIFGPRPV